MHIEVKYQIYCLSGKLKVLFMRVAVKSLIKYSAVFFIELLSVSALAASPLCLEYSSGSGHYFQYHGKVKQVYVNENNLILIYFEEPISVEDVLRCGLSVNSGSAGSFQIDAQPEYAKLLYSTALAAQATGRPVSVQMRSVQSGYLKIDRIWLAE